MLPYDFGIWISEARNVIGNKSVESSSKATSGQVRKETQSQGGDDTEVVEVPVSDRADEMPMESRTALILSVLNLREYARCIFRENQTIRGPRNSVT